jgi:iron complex transport system substrate-binding protein
VKIPLPINRIVTISDGLVEGVLTVLGEQDKIVGLGSGCLPSDFSYEFKTENGEREIYEGGMNPVTFLNPGFRDLPVVVQSGGAINLEALAALRPDLVILRVGDCSYRYSDENFDKTLGLLESLKIPVFVLLATHLQNENPLNALSEEIIAIGRVFGKEQRACALAELLQKKVEFVRERTARRRGEPRSVLLLGLSCSSRSGGGIANAQGKGTIENSYLEEIVGARNAFAGEGYFKVLSTEHLLALNPEVIILYTSAGYHPPVELLESPEFRVLRVLDAVRNRRVAALPWSPCNCDKRLEYPLDVMIIAKTVYPELFEDINLGEWILDFYVDVYGVGRETAAGLRSCQWLDWTVGY